MLLTLGAAGAMNAQFSGGNGTSSSPYEIASTNDWNTLADNLSTYQSSYFKMTANVGTVTKMVGSKNTPFKGIFDGDGYTLTVDITDQTNQGTAPFSCINNATIKNLKVTGTVTSTYHGSGLVGFTVGDNTIENCHISTNVESDNTHIGGIVGHGQEATVRIIGCVYDGNLKSSNHIGGLLGWSNAGIHLYVSNSLFNGTTENNSNKFHPIAFRNGSVSSYGYFTNCYYTKDSNFSDSGSTNNLFHQGNNYHMYGTIYKHAYPVSGSNVTVALTGTTEYEYNVSQITGYSIYESSSSTNSGIVYDGTVYAGYSDNLSLLLSYTGSNVLESYSTTGGTLTGSAITGSNDAYTLTMPSSNVTINATATAQPVLHDSDGNYMTWAQFAANVMNNVSYSGKTVYLDADVTVTEPIGIHSAASSDGQNHFFAGTFDGQDHTVTLDMTTTHDKYGLFGVLNSAIVKDLIIDGTINSTHYHTGGLTGYTLNACDITNCVSNVTINSTVSSTDYGYCGGFVGELDGGSSVTFNGCAFTGKLTCTNYSGGFVGRFINHYTNSSYLTFNDCLYASTNSSCTGSSYAAFVYKTSSSNTRFTINNSYYTTAFGTSQGKQGYTITGDTDRNVTVDMSGNGTDYDVSGIIAYSTGMVYGGTIYAGSGDNVSLTLNGGGGANNNRYYALPSGTTLNTSTGVLTMPANDVTITNARRFADSGQWSYYSYWRPQQVPESDEDVIIEGSVYISSNDVAKIHNIEISGSGSINMSEGGQLQHCNDGVVAKMGKAIEGYGSSTGRDHFYMMALPFTSFDVAESPLVTNGAYALFKFNGSQLQEEWVNYVQPNQATGFSTIGNGEGFLYANTNTFTPYLYLTGTLVPSDQAKSFTLSYDASTTFGAWNLVGNPFACNATSSITDYYVIGGQNDDEVVPSSGVIKPMQGIFVKASATTSSVTFTPTTENSNNNTSSSVNLMLKPADTRDAKVIDLARIRFGEGEGLEKFQLNPDHTKVYIPQNGMDYAVVHTQAEGELPLNFKAENNGRYTLSVDIEKVSFDYLHLIDNMTGADVDLLATPTYTFDARTTDYASRFRLVFAATGIEENGASTGSATFAYYNGSEWNIANNGEATLQVIDIMGRVLSSQVINGNTSINLNQSAGVYMLRLVDGNSVRTQKVIVK